MIKSLIIIVVIGVLSLQFSDLTSQSVFYSAILPACVFFSAIALALWFVIRNQKKGISQNAKPDRSGNPLSGGDGGGDC